MTDSSDTGDSSDLPNYLPTDLPKVTVVRVVTVVTVVKEVTKNGTTLVLTKMFTKKKCEFFVTNYCVTKKN